ncbi:unnamed protein product [Kluyveromyces dobzhanskii CBS 2104]|uniref:WGS project CCBQ000000000 data, contig 00058 n=1 Tax=Kluyveromyces dobzhanskii CBS 2104 TaxID=1427455 RepID=A0A0A8LBE0_9SACH|nr:unnamed protein product [Kluyveromyces dobzhanskii CBS 2104]
MVGLKLKSAFQFKKKANDKESSTPGKVSKLSAIGNDLHPQDYEALRPLLTLLNVQSSKCYAFENVSGAFVVKFGDKGFVPVTKFSLIATNLTLYIGSVDSNGTAEDVVDIDVKMLWDHRIVREGENYNLSFEPNCDICLVSPRLEDVRQLSKIISLAQFEYGSLFKALTASIISLMGLKISDIQLILKNNYSFKDWCYININNEWVKAWCHIDKSSKASDPKGKSKVKFYRDDKSTSKKNLICFISDVSTVEDIFLSTEPIHSHKTHDEDWDIDALKTLMHSGLNSADALDTFMEKLDTVSVIGTINWTHLDPLSDSPRSSKSRSSSFAWTPKSPRKRMSSISDSKSQARAGENSVSDLTQLTSSLKNHTRNVSTVSTDSSAVIDIDDATASVTTERFMFKPIPHAGVHHLESIIRFLIPVYDCLQLYGRPTAFKSTREDVNSLSFGLPKLPTIDYFSKEELQWAFTATDYKTDPVSRWTFFKTLLEDCYKNPSRDSDESFRTLVDAWNTPNISIPLSSVRSGLQYSASPNKSNDSPPIV